MGKFIAGLLALLVAFPTPAYATQTIVRAQDSEGFLTLRNLLIDSGGETTGGAAAPYWTASGGGFNLTTTSTKVARGNHALLFDASAASQTVTATAVAIPDGMKGRNGVVSCVFKATTGTATHTLTADDGSGNNFATPVTIASSTTSFQRTSVNFIFPTSGNVRLKITSAADEPETAIDDCYLGLADGFNLMQVSQAQYVGSIAFARKASCSWQITGTTFANFSADTDCDGSPTVDGSVTAPATKIPGAFLASYPPGEYLIVSNGNFVRSNVDRYAYFRFSDGTNSSTEQSAYVSGANYIGGGNLIGRIKNTTQQANVTIQVQAKVDSTTGSPMAFIDGDTYPLNISIYRFPLSSDQAFRSETAAFIWSGYHDANCDFTTTSASYVLPTGDASCTFTEVLNIGAGTVSSQTNGGDNTSGLSWTPKTTGQYEVCADFTMYEDTASATVNAMLYDSVAGNGPTQNYRAPVSGGYVAPFNLCRILDVTSTATRTTELRMAVGSNTGHLTAIGFTGDRAISWRIKKLSQNVPAPVIVGGIKGTQTNDNPSPGYIGEVVESTVTTATAVPGASTAFADTNCSASFTAGDWMIGGAVEEQLNGATLTGQVRASVNAGSVVFDGDDLFDALPATSTSNSTVTIPAKRFSLASTTTVRLTVAASYSAGTPKYVCRMSGWRIR